MRLIRVYFQGRSQTYKSKLLELNGTYRLGHFLVYHICKINKKSNTPFFTKIHSFLQKAIIVLVRVYKSAVQQI